MLVNMEYLNLLLQFNVENVYQSKVNKAVLVHAMKAYGEAMELDGQVHTLAASPKGKLPPLTT
jgi:hypothetical protein